MAVYFSGRRQIGSFVLYPHRRAVLTCEIFERWEDIERGSTARCGAPGSVEVKKEVGLSQRDYETLKTSIEGSIGVQGIASLKSTVEETLGREATWSVSESTTKTFSFNSPDCGRRSETIYQLVREYQLSYRRERLFSTETWERLLRERTQCHDAVPEIEPYDDLCGCPRPARPSYDGRLVVEMGDSSMRVQYRRTADGVELHFGNSVGSASLNPTQRVRASIPTVFIPESLKFLGAIEGEQVDAIISPYHEAPMAQAVSLRSFVDEEAEEFVVRTQRTRQRFDVEGEGQAS